MSKEQREAVDAALRAIPFDPTRTPAEQRAWFESFAIAPLPGDVTANEVILGGVSALDLLVAGATGTPTILYFHGGGYVVGSARSGIRLAAELARRTDGRAVSVDYRLAPEHPYPAAVEDGIAAYAALLESGVSPQAAVLAGDSAGGGLAVATLIAARNRGLPQPAAAAVFSPWADITLSGESMRSKEGVDPLFNPDTVSWFANHYIPDGDRSVPLASPVYASLSGLPPLLIQAGSHEMLLDDSVRLAGRAALDDVDVRLEVVAEVPHVFQKQFGQLDEADEALDRAAHWLRAATEAAQERERGRDH